jgi:hypothetical protein
MPSSIIQPDSSEEIIKKKLHPLVFAANIIWMITGAFQCLYLIYGPRKEGEYKGYVVLANLGFVLVVAVPTLTYLTTFKKFIKLTFLIDMMLMTTVIAIIAFVNMILMFDKGGVWYYLVIEVTYTIHIFLYSGVIRVFLVTLQWSKW